MKFQEDSKRSLHHGHNVDEKYVTYNIKLTQGNKEGNFSLFKIFVYYLKIRFK